MRLKHGYSRDGPPELKTGGCNSFRSLRAICLPTTYMCPEDGNCNDQKTIARLVSSHVQSFRDEAESQPCCRRLRDVCAGVDSCVS